jgi:hypothetical protein
VLFHEGLRTHNLDRKPQAIPTNDVVSFVPLYKLFRDIVEELGNDVPSSVEAYCEIIVATKALGTDHIVIESST